MCLVYSDISVVTSTSSICEAKHYLNDTGFQQHAPLCATAGDASQLINLMAAGLSFSSTAGHTDMLSDIGVHRTQLTCAAGFMDGKIKKKSCCLLI